ncbi:hypothetical protein PseudUWO311_09290 [Pseudanabaena sp. UWO311]|uniref:hypothetical protein n=1 Tax=Pseudanabaena sp. UWO311 TaxID=2487337 RepID=UPI00115BDA0E|nr:hypothetical protein [Pseudanabaena sp. UWO311]TYQ27184.1 hypothetical protein PseudUWO311_09290 [Pseudanabaena sp. UWO311]
MRSPYHSNHLTAIAYSPKNKNNAITPSFKLLTSDRLFQKIKNKAIAPSFKSPNSDRLFIKNNAIATSVKFFNNLVHITWE